MKAGRKSRESHRASLTSALSPGQSLLGCCSYPLFTPQPLETAHRLLRRAPPLPRSSELSAPWSLANYSTLQQHGATSSTTLCITQDMSRQPPTINPWSSGRTRRGKLATTAARGDNNRILLTHILLSNHPQTQAPQSLVVEIIFTKPSTTSTEGKKVPAAQNKVYVGWTGMPSSVASVTQQVRGGAAAGADRIEIDPQFAAMLGMGGLEGSSVRFLLPTRLEKWSQKLLRWIADGYRWVTGVD